MLRHNPDSFRHPDRNAAAFADRCAHAYAREHAHPRRASVTYHTSDAANDSRALAYAVSYANRYAECLPYALAEAERALAPADHPPRDRR